MSSATTQRHRHPSIPKSLTHKALSCFALSPRPSRATIRASGNGTLPFSPPHHRQSAAELRDRRGQRKPMLLCLFSLLSKHLRRS
jgi:hypothetical protein